MKSKPSVKPAQPHKKAPGFLVKRFRNLLASTESVVGLQSHQQRPSRATDHNAPHGGTSLHSLERSRTKCQIRCQPTTGSGGKFSEHDASVFCSRSEKFSGTDFVDRLHGSGMSAWIEPSESPELVRVTLAWSNRGGGPPCGRANKFRRVLRRVLSLLRLLSVSRRTWLSLDPHDTTTTPASVRA